MGFWGFGGRLVGGKKCWAGGDGAVGEADGVAFVFVGVAASAVAGFAGGDEVVGGVGAASVMFDEVVGFGGGCAAPVACGVALEDGTSSREVCRVAGSFGHWLPPRFARWVDASAEGHRLASAF